MNSPHTASSSRDWGIKRESLRIDTAEAADPAASAPTLASCRTQTDGQTLPLALCQARGANGYNPGFGGGGGGEEPAAKEAPPLFARPPAAVGIET